jgi:hypothetical protein
MARTCKGFPRRAAPRLSLLLALALLLLPAARGAAAAHDEGDPEAPPSREEQHDALL